MKHQWILANATLDIGPSAGNGNSNAAQNIAAPGTVTVDSAGGPDTAARDAAPGGAIGILGSPLFLIVILGAMMLFLMRSNKKQQQKRVQMLDTIVKGSRVMLNTGIYGTVAEVRDKTYLVEIADKVCVEVVKNGVADVVNTTAPAESK